MDGPARNLQVFPPGVSIDKGDEVYVFAKSIKTSGLGAVTDIMDDKHPTYPSRYQVNFHEGGTWHVKPDRLLGLYTAKCNAHTTVVVCYSTEDYRKLSRSQVNKNDFVIEIGSSFGKATHVLHQQGAKVIGIEKATVVIAAARKKYPHLHFEQLDVLEDSEQFNSLAKGCTKMFLDIGGTRSMGTIKRILPVLVDSLQPSLRLVVIKNEELHTYLMQHPKGQPVTYETLVADSPANADLTAAGEDSAPAGNQNHQAEAAALP
eukprot:TRINITY_DN116048_c0_g1_i1.p1 TRINITY_DN116048_c0_g1~~TRINITY_DN116048_c0_g1_i1.p1  ORF type:complete len:262 (-),score=19.49 TRINITY_DN116048_c0_g1_i1:82-867(-)